MQRHLLRLLCTAIAALSFLAEAQAALVVVNSVSEVGPSTTITNDFLNTLVNIPGAGVVADFDTYFFSVDDSANHALPGSVNAVDLPFSVEDRVFFRESEAALVPDPAGMRFGVADPSSMFIAAVKQNFFQVVRTGTVAAGYLNGAEMGADNWVYFSNNDSGNMKPSFWAQLNLTSTSATPIRYVYDPMNLSRDITMSEAICATSVPEPSAFLCLAAVGLTAFGLNRFRKGNAE